MIEKKWVTKEEAKEMFPGYNDAPCKECYLWNKAAIEAGKAGGMCEECFNKGFVHFEDKFKEIDK